MEGFCGVIMASLLLVQATSARTSMKSQEAPAPQGASQQKVIDQKALDEASLLNQRAVKLYGEGKYDEALPLIKRALETYEGQLGENHYLVKVALNNMAAVHMAKRNYGAAEKIYERLLESYEKALKPDRVNASKALENLARVHIYRREFDSSEREYRRALAYREGAQGAEHPDVAETVFRLAVLYQWRGDYDKAAAHYARAISIWEKKPEAAREDYALALQRYACIIRGDGHEKEAEEFAKRAGEIRAAASAAADSGQAADSGRLVRGGVLNGKAISKPQPDYPAEAKSARQSGVVVVQITVDEAGWVIDACAVSGAPLLRRASERAAYQSRFTPTLLSGQPVKVTGVITYNFVLY